MDPMPRLGSWFQSFFKKDPISGQGWYEFVLHSIQYQDQDGMFKSP
jgi:hypothetical protein